MMKNLILFSTIILLGLSSCLEKGETQFSGESFSMISMDKKGLVYAKVVTNDMRAAFITSPQIKQLAPGTFAIIAYSWTESNGITQTDEGLQVYNANTTAEIKQLPKTTLYPSDAPATPNDPFLLYAPTYDSGLYFNDHWMFPYSFKHKEGETGTLRFYKSTTAPKTENSNEIIVDIRLVKSGTATGTTEKTTQSGIVVDMSQLREGTPTTGTTTKTLQIKFRFYREGQTEPFTTQPFPMLVFTN